MKISEKIKEMFFRFCKFLFRYVFFLGGFYFVSLCVFFGFYFVLFLFAIEKG